MNYHTNMHINNISFKIFVIPVITITIVVVIVIIIIITTIIGKNRCQRLLSLDSSSEFFLLKAGLGHLVLRTPVLILKSLIHRLA
jgi:hypothetical protein